MWSVFADDPADFAYRHLGYRDAALKVTMRRAGLNPRIGLVAPLVKENIRRVEVGIALWRLLTRPEDDVLVGVGAESIWTGWLRDVEAIIGGGSFELREEVHVINRKVIHRMGSFGCIHRFLSSPVRPRIPPARGTAPTMILCGLDRASTETVLECARQFVPPSLFVTSVYPVLAHGLTT
jgi:hypothetical protein